MQFVCSIAAIALSRSFGWVPFTLLALLGAGEARALVAPSSCASLPNEQYAPAGDGFCASYGPAHCSVAAPVVANQRGNVLIAVLDDHGYCQNGFMSGRVVGPNDAALERCTGRVCSEAPWISCADDDGCPGTMTCLAAPEGECGEGGSCTHGYCAQCDAESPCGAGELCVDGLCSPKADCTVGGQFVCELGDTCAAVTNACSSGTCSQSGTPCGTSADCPAKVCAATPARCSRDTDVGAEGYACTSSEHPLRLNDLSCRYRVPDAEKWNYEPDTSTRNAPPLEQIVYTPQIDELAREGAVFPNAWAGGQTCKPARRTLLTGRWMRHHRNAGQKNNGDGVRQCAAPATGLDEPRGCSPLEADADGSSDCNAARACEKIHSIPWWLETTGPGRCKNSTTSCASDAQCTTGSGDECLQAHTVGIGKSHFVNFDKLSFDVDIREGSGPPIGKFPCDGTNQCQQALEAGNLSCRVRVTNEAYSLAPIFTEIATTAASGQQREPLFLYYAPELPHEPTNAGTYFRGLYETTGELTLEDDKHLARTSWFDAGLRAIVDDLQRTCVCTGDDTAESMYDRTTVVVLPDHGFLMDRAKNDDGFASANGQRMAMVLNAPEHRGRATGEVLDGFGYAAGSPDVMPTVLDYSGLTATHSRELATGANDLYPLNGSLRSLALDGMDAGGFLRNHYSHSGDNSDSGSGVAEDTRHFVITAPDVLGVCTNGTKTLHGHAKLCLTATDCGGSSTPSHCSKPALRCANEPGRGCESDADCGICGGTSCASGFDDFDNDAAGTPRSCSTDGDCHVPKGVCAPPQIKVVRKAGAIVDVYDLTWDPDETVNLRGNQAPGDPSYLPSGFVTDVQTCLGEFFTLRTTDAVWQPPTGVASSCPVSMREW